MFSFLRKGILKILSKKESSGSWDNQELREIISEIRELFLKADVHFSVVQRLFDELERDLLGDNTELFPITNNTIINIFRKNLSNLLCCNKKENNAQVDWFLKDSVNVWLLCGLQGHGKTTQTGKLAYFLRNQYPDRSVMLVGCDFDRPMAGKQLQVIGEQVCVPVLLSNENESLTDFLFRAKQIAKEQKIDTLLVDTAGRLHINEQAMANLELMNHILVPDHKIFIINAAKGSSILDVAKEFHDRIGLTGSIITMLDSVAKGGCALSLVHVLNIPILFEGIGEHMEDLQIFNPDSMADRILGLGDMLNLKRKMSVMSDVPDMDKARERFFSGQFTFEDYLEQMKVIKKLGPLSGLLKMLPGCADVSIDDRDFIRAEVIIRSMTKKERMCQKPFSEERLIKIANGSGNSLQEVVRLVENFKRFRCAMQKIGASFDADRLRAILGDLTWR